MMQGMMEYRMTMMTAMVVVVVVACFGNSRRFITCWHLMESLWVSNVQ